MNNATFNAVRNERGEPVMQIVTDHRLGRIAVNLDGLARVEKCPSPRWVKGKNIVSGQAFEESPEWVREHGFHMKDGDKGEFLIIDVPAIARKQDRKFKKRVAESSQMSLFAGV